MKRTYWPILQSILGKRNPKERTRFTLIVGLGNPGSEYTETRHNTGFWCVDHLIEKGTIDFRQRQQQATICEGTLSKTPVILAKPRTFVNDSGQAVKYLLTRYQASPANLLVILDDMNLPVGKLRLRTHGSAGGHNGMKSIIEYIGTQNFTRLRIGIGHPPAGMDKAAYVLTSMSSEERTTVENAVKRASQAVMCMLKNGVDNAMGKFN